jgi:V/A-type H+-transporting ATPase subunit I
MTNKTLMCLFDITIHDSYRNLLLQELSKINSIHIKPKKEGLKLIDKGEVPIENIKKLRAAVELLFKALKITDYDIQKLDVDKTKRRVFEVKDISELIHFILEEISFYSNRVAELESYITKVKLELNNMKIIEESYRFLEEINLTRDNYTHFNILAFKVFTSFSKNLDNIENLFDFSNFPNYYETKNISEDRTVFYTIYPKDKEEDLKERIRVAHAEEVPILKKYLTSEGINFTRISKEINFVDSTLFKYEKELERLRDENMPLFSAIYEIVQNIEEYNWADRQFDESIANRLEIKFFIPVDKKNEVQERLIEVFKDQITIHSVKIRKKEVVDSKTEKEYKSEKVGKEKGNHPEELENEEDLRNEAPTIMKNNFFVRPFETLTRMFGTPAYSEIDPTPFLAIMFPLLFGLMFGDIGHGLVLIIAGLVGVIVFKNKKGSDFLNFCWIIFYCGWGAILCGFLYGEFFGMHDIEIGGQILLHLEPITIPILNLTLHNPIGNIMTVFSFAVLIGVVHINLGWFIQFLNYWRQSRKYLAFSDSLIKILLLSGGALLIFTYSFDINAWIAPPYPILLTIVPGILLIILKPLGKVFGISYLKKEKYSELVGEGSMETFETLLSILSNVASYIRLLALALAHISLMIAIQAMAELIQGQGILVEIVKIIGLIFGNVVVILIEGLLVFLNALRLNFYEFFFKFYKGTGTEFYPFYLNDHFSKIKFKVSVEKDVISEEIEKTIESKKTQENIKEATKYISKKYF